MKNTIIIVLLFAFKLAHSQYVIPNGNGENQNLISTSYEYTLNDYPEELVPNGPLLCGCPNPIYTSSVVYSEAKIYNRSNEYFNLDNFNYESDKPVNLELSSKQRVHLNPGFEFTAENGNKLKASISSQNINDTKITNYLESNLTTSKVSSTALNIKFENVLSSYPNEILLINIYDSLGNNVYSTGAGSIFGSGDIDETVYGLSSGIYILNLSYLGKNISKTISF